MSVFKSLHDKFGVASENGSPLCNAFRIGVDNLTVRLDADPVGLASKGQDFSSKATNDQILTLSA